MRRAHRKANNTFYQKLRQASLHLAKWIGLASGTGLLVGSIIQVFLLLFFPLQEMVFKAFWVNPYLLLIIPPSAAFVVGILLHNKFTNRAWGWGPGLDISIMEIQGRKKGYSHMLAFPVKFLAQLIGIGFGNSGGLLGPSGRIGQGFVHYIGHFLKLTGKYKDALKLDMQALATMALAAGLAATIRLPLGAGLFAIEVIYGEKLYSGKVDREHVVYAEWAGVSGAVTSIYLFGNQPFFGMISNAPPISNYPLFALLGFLAGFTALMFIKYYHFVIRVFRRIHLPRYIKPFVASLTVSIVTLLLLFNTKGLYDTAPEGSPYISFAPQAQLWVPETTRESKLVGEGLEKSALHATPNWMGFGAENVMLVKNLQVVDSNADGDYDQVVLKLNGGTHSLSIMSAILILLILILGKIFATGTYVGSGASGGMIMPSLIIGAGLGGVFALTLVSLGWLDPMYVSAFVAVGAVAVLSGVANAPLASGIFSLELFGIGFLGPTMMATMIAFSLSHFETIYIRPSDLKHQDINKPDAE